VNNIGGTIRAGAIVACFVLFTVPLMPVQMLFLRSNAGFARRFPHWYHGWVCQILGIRLSTSGCIVRGQPVLVISNHASWLDIPVLSAIAPVSFVAKKEIAGWPFVSTLARLQQTVFVDRERRTSVGVSANEILGRLASGDSIVLFAEGTSSDGNRVLPFKTSLFAAAKPTQSNSPQTGPQAATSTTVVQTVSIVYARRHGLPLGWAGRRRFSYFGDVGIGSNAWDILTGGPLEAVIKISTPVPLDAFKDRKDLAKRAEDAVRTGFLEALRK
jgi:lyso-ornithine lipid O-acyltransferase